MPPECRAPEYYAAVRSANGCQAGRACGLDSRLENAVRRGDLQAACALITIGADVNYGSPKPMLFDAVALNNLPLLTLLAYNGADVNKAAFINLGPGRRLELESPLHRAAISAFYQVGAFLVENGAEVNKAVGRNSETPLHYLANHPTTSASGDPGRFAELLVSNGADVNARNLFGHTPLYVVALGGPAEVLPPLLRGGADPNIPIVERAGNRANFADFALVRAADLDYVAAVSILLDFKERSTLDINIVEENRGLGALHVAESAAVVELLLDAGADANLASAPLGPGHEAGLSPLDWMARQGRYPAAERLYRGGGRCLRPRADLAFCEWE